MIDRYSFPLKLNTLSEDIEKYWFDKKCKKNLHSVDTFYYTIKLQQNFTRSTSDVNVLRFRDWALHDTSEVFTFGSREYIRKNATFARYYSVCFHVPDYYDVFLATETPDNANGESLSSEVVVQLRSYYLWQRGVHAAFEESYSEVLELLKFFNFSVSFVQENRADFCWHTNYLRQPEKFLTPGDGKSTTFDKMLFTRLADTHPFTVLYNRNGDAENKISYLAFGMRGQKFFVRIYDKVREVLEMNYKPWFFKLWLSHNLISRYDFYCLDYVYSEFTPRYRYKKLNVARLKFYIDELHQSVDISDIDVVEKIFSGDITDETVISSLADKYTPPITRIFNIEFQVMRKASKSFILIPGAGGKYAEAQQIYDYLDNHDLIVEYLTRKVFALKDPDSQLRKKDRDFCAFWKSIRATKLVDCRKHPDTVKLVRQYNSKKSADVVKKRIVNSVTSLSFYLKGDNDANLIKDFADVVGMLNDNDIEKAFYYKRRKQKTFNPDELLPSGSVGYSSGFVIVNSDTGEVLTDG